MAIVYRRKKIRGRYPILELLFPKKIRETRCSECGRPFLEHPEREPDLCMSEDNVELFLYRDQVGKETRYRLRVGAWRLNNDEYMLSQLFKCEEVWALQCVFTKAVEFVKAEREKQKKQTAKK